LDNRTGIQQALAAFTDRPLAAAARGLFSSLGYTSDRRIDSIPNTAAAFTHQFGQINPERALTDDWHTVDLLFQLTERELGANLPLTPGKVDNTIIESYLFLAIDLKGGQYSRTRLANATREINRLFPMPAMTLFRHGETASLAVIDRELNQRDATRDVLRKVTLIKDIRLGDPARVHVDILHDLSLPALQNEFKLQTFVDLHRAWARKLENSEINKRFYQDIANWYFCAQRHPGVRLPRDIDRNSAEARSIFFIRLLTRLIFCWFLQEKGLIPRRLFRWNEVKTLLKDTRLTSGSYYQAILQNLFFATLNREPEKREFRGLRPDAWYDEGRGVTNLYRYEELLTGKNALLDLLRDVPFVNGGLFDCLDDIPRKSEQRPAVRMDGFSDNPRESASIPTELFFGQDLLADLSQDYNDRSKDHVKVRPLIETLSHYKFTVEENTPLDQEIALDPELLGKVFENLLASYNDETSTIARKKLGAFYTPRDVVNYMVDEALIARFESIVPQLKLRRLLSDQAGNPCTEAETVSLIEAIEQTRILDPACGSGAFPMGALHRLVHLLSKLDPNNVRWKQRQLDAARRDLERAEADPESRANAHAKYQDRISDIGRSFDTAHHDLDYARKLYLIENSIFGVDIQPIACQIAKLRFFIALLVDQKSHTRIRPLPNLETRIVAANALIPASEQKGLQFSFESPEVAELRERLRKIRSEHFNARSPEQKQRSREKDAAIRGRLLTALSGHMSKDSAEALARWDPYDQNRHAAFFEPQWTFSFPPDFTGFDIVIGNPPYVRQEKIKDEKHVFKKLYQCFTGTADLYVYFYERGIQLLKDGGVFSFITANKWMRSGYGERLRAFLKANTRVRRLIDFGDAEIFDAIAYPCIIVLENRKPAADSAFDALNWNPQEWKVEDVSRHLAGDMFPVSQSDLAPEAWRLESKTKLKLLDRIKAAGVPLGKYVNGRFYRGILTGLNEAFVVSREKRDELIAEHPSSAEVLKPFLRGRDIKRWRVEFDEQYLIFTRRGINIKAHPAIYRHLKSYKDQLEPCPPNWNTKRDGPWGGRKTGSYKWYEIQDNIAYWQEFDQSKIIYPDIYEHQSFAWDVRGFYGANTCYFIPTSEKWLTALLNSVCVEWFYSQISNKIRGGYLRAFSDYMKQVPIPQATIEQQSTIERLADAIIHLKGQGPAAAYFERILNALVYELFFAEDLHGRKLRFFDLLIATKSPKLTTKGAITAFHEEIAAPNHPLHAALDALRRIEAVRIIEEGTDKSQAAIAAHGD
jgi:adenine-specific DNA-methyltransferase